jgi:hypothetical protein
MMGTRENEEVQDGFFCEALPGNERPPPGRFAAVISDQWPVEEKKQGFRIRALGIEKSLKPQGRAAARQ